MTSIVPVAGATAGFGATVARRFVRDGHRVGTTGRRAERLEGLAIDAGTTPLTADDTAEAVAWVVGLPPHVNINRMELMPTRQAPGPLAIRRSGT